jgi:hypothetical protein
LIGRLPQSPLTTIAADWIPNFSKTDIVIPAVRAAPAKVPTMYHPPARPSSGFGTSVAIIPPVAEEATVLKAVDRVISAVKTERLPRITVRAENSPAAVQNPLSTMRLRRFQPRSTIGAHKKERKSGKHAMAPTVAI